MGARLLRALPQSRWTWNYTIVDEATPIGRIHTSWFRGRVTLTVLGTSYRVYRERTRRDACFLESEGKVLTRATPCRDGLHSVVVEHAVGRHTLRKKLRAGRDFLLLANGQEVGSIQPEGRFNRRVRASLPDDLPLPLDVFLIWLVLRSWRNDDGMIDHPSPNFA